MLTPNRLTIDERQLLIEALKDHCSHLDAAARAARLKGFGLHVEQPFRRASRDCKALLAKLQGQQAPDPCEPLRELLREAVEYQADVFDSDPSEGVELQSSADAVSWFAAWRLRVKDIVGGRSNG